MVVENGQSGEVEGARRRRQLVWVWGSWTRLIRDCKVCAGCVYVDGVEFMNFTS